MSDYTLSIGSISSLWWRDVISLGKGIGGSSQMFDVVLVIVITSDFGNLNGTAIILFVNYFPIFLLKRPLKMLCYPRE
jgi:hypothetical protein